MELSLYILGLINKLINSKRDFIVEDYGTSSIKLHDDDSEIVFEVTDVNILKIHWIKYANGVFRRNFVLFEECTEKQLMKAISETFFLEEVSADE
jgi:hypothetical protein